MELLKISDAFEQRSCFDNYLTSDRKYLHLSYLSLEEPCKIESYDEFFDQLDRTENTYKTVERLYLETDHITSIPHNMIDFDNLTELTITGSRFWDLNMLQVPTTVKILSLIEHSNLQSSCLLGMEDLINLEELYLDAETFFLHHLFPDRARDESDHNEIPIPDLPQLKLITFVYNESRFWEELKENWMDLLRYDPLLSQIIGRIDTIVVPGDFVDKITILLKKEMS